jgi:prolyl-tRNA editing enzyme YbaK/EbsC (Cys-tRNA(Pro) deacylase)
VRLPVFPDAREFPQGTRTAQDAAAAIGCEVAQIVKSLVFVTGDGEPRLVLCSGANTVDAERLGLRRADPDLVRRVTGAAIGGVPPFGHPQPIATLVDEDLMAHEVVWAAAGTPSTVFPIAPAELVERTRGQLARVSRGS